MKLLFLNLKQSVRTISKNKLQTFFSLFGLVVGLVSFSFSGNWLWNEIHYDSFRNGHENLYGVCHKNFSDNYSDVLSGNLCAMFDTIPEAEAIPFNRYYGTFFNEEGGEIALKDGDVMRTDSSFLDAFDVKLLYGDISTVFDRPGNVIVTKHFAEANFGQADAIGKILKEGNGAVWTVAGVSENTNAYTSVPFEVLVNTPLATYSPFSWSYKLFVRTHDLDALKKRLSKTIDEFSLEFIPIRHVASVVDYDTYFHAYLYPVSFTLMSLLLLLASVFNFLSILLSMFLGRLREYKLRIGLGASVRSNAGWLLTQLLIPLVLVFFISAVSLELITYWSGLERESTLVYRRFYVCFGIMVGLIGLGMLYVFSVIRRNYHHSFGNAVKPKTGYVNLLFVQFAVCALLMLVFITGYRQFRLLVDTDLGFQTENMFRIRCEEAGLSVHSVQQTLVPAIRSGGYSCLEDAVLLKRDFFESSNQSNFNFERNGEEYHIYIMYMSPKAFNFFGIQPQEGKIYQGTVDNGVETVLLNRAASQVMGWGVGDGGVIGYHPDMAVRAVGIVDFKTRNFHRASPPYMFEYVADDDLETGFTDGSLYIKYQPGKQEEAQKVVMQLIADLGGKENFAIQTFKRFIQHYYDREQAYIRVFSVIAGSSLLITLFGVFSLIVYTLRVQRKGIAVRRVFGATFRDLCQSYLYRYILLALVANAIAFPVGYYLIQLWLENYSSVVSINILQGLLIALGMLVVVSLVIINRIHVVMRENPADVVKSE